MRLGNPSFLLLVLAAVSAAQDTNFAVGPQYLMNYGSPLFAQPIATPSLSLEAPLAGIPSLPAIGPAVEGQSYVANPELRHQADLFPIYYGYPMATVVELTSGELPRELPASIVDTGVAWITDAQSLREHGYDIPLGDAASFWKVHGPHSPRVYTNIDVERLHTN
jgi:hypothetical protein